MRPDDKRISQSIRPFEQDDEEGDDDAGDRADDKRQNGQDREAPILSFQFVPTFQFRDHSRAGFRPSEDSHPASRACQSTLTILPKSLPRLFVPLRRSRSNRAATEFSKRNPSPPVRPTDSSLASGGIVRIKPGASTAEQWIKPGAFDSRSTFGVLVDERYNLLWVCSKLRLLCSPNECSGAFSIPALRNRSLASNASATQPEGRPHMGSHDEIG